MPSQTAELVFPAGGVHKGFAYQHQAPFTTVDALNVRPTETLEDRVRGGSRPGLTKAFPGQLGSGNPIRLLNQVRTALLDSTVLWRDDFESDFLSAIWSATSAGAIIDIDDVAGERMGGYQDIVGSIDDVTRSAVRDALPPEFDTTLPTIVTADILNRSTDSEIDLLMFGDANLDVYTVGGISVQIKRTAASSHSASIKADVIDEFGSLVKTSTIAFTSKGNRYDSIRIVFDPAPNPRTLNVYAEDILLVTHTMTPGQTNTWEDRNRMGFTAFVTNSLASAHLSFYQVEYSNTLIKERKRTFAVAGANGILYRDNDDGDMNVITLDNSLTIATDRIINSVDRLQRLYISDHGLAHSETDGNLSTNDGLKFKSATLTDFTLLTPAVSKENYILELLDDGDTAKAIPGVYRITDATTETLTLDRPANVGTNQETGITFRIVRSPKVYDPVDDELTEWQQKDGSTGMPSDASLISVYRDRLVLAGVINTPNLWFMSKQGDPNDWIYGGTNPGRAVAGDLSTDQEEAGAVGEPITALIPFNNDFFIFGCESSLWVLRDDPARGGSIDNISSTVGVITGNAWTRTPDGSTVVMGRDGLYLVSVNGSVQPLSRRGLPKDLANINIETHEINLTYDAVDHGIHIFITEKEGGAGQHWWLNWDLKSFWPVQLQSDHEPFISHYFDASSSDQAGVLLGCRDGFLRKFHPSAEDDDGTNFASRLLYGPVRLGRNQMSDGIVENLDIVMAINSGNVDVGVKVGDSARNAFDAALDVTDSVAAGHDFLAPNRRGHSCFVSLASAGGDAWAIDSLSITRRTAGRNRLL